MGTPLLHNARLTGASYLAVFIAGLVYIELIPHIGLIGNNFDLAVNEIWIASRHFGSAMPSS